MPRSTRLALLAAAITCAFAAPSRAQTAAPGRVAAALRQILTGPERYAVDAIGLSASGRRIAALEPLVPPVATQRRLVLVGGLDGHPDSTRAVLDVLAWGFAAGTPSSNRRRWQVAAVPCVLPERCDVDDAAAMPPPAIALPPEKGYYDAPEFREARYLWRWVSMLGPDLVIEVRRGDTLEWRVNALGNGRVASSGSAAGDSLAGALGTGRPSGLAPVAALQLSGPPAEVSAALRALLQGLPAGEPSPLRRALTDRQSRTPIELARLLAEKYPANPIMSYIPALSWSGALRLSALTGDPRYADRARGQMTPFASGTRPAIAEPYLLTSLAGHQAFFDAASDEADTALARRAADFMLATEPGQIVRFATGWTDDMFMATSVLARAAARSGDPKYADAVARLLLDSISRLQREDRLFMHAGSGPHAWGRGNGFAAFGLMEALTHLPDSWPAGFRVAQAFERLMSGLRRHQAPDGAWHQVVDEPGTYREFTVTAMTVAAMARGIRLGWLDGSYREVVERGWRAVLARVSETGELVDVCSGTGAGANATREYYLNRPAIFGPDDRGGAMALTAALEMHALTTTR